MVRFLWVALVAVASLGAMAADTGWVEFASASSVSPGGVSWVSPSNALTNGATYASADVEEDTTRFLQVTNCSAGMGSVSGTLDGIEIEVQGTGDDGSMQSFIDHTMQLIVGGVRVGTNKARSSSWSWTDSSTNVVVYGGPTDLWGSGVTLADLSSSNFGFAFRVENEDRNPADIEIYLIRIKVYYTAAASGPSADVLGAGFFQLLGRR